MSEMQAQVFLSFLQTPLVVIKIMQKSRVEVKVQGLLQLLLIQLMNTFTASTILLQKQIYIYMFI